MRELARTLLSYAETRARIAAGEMEEQVVRLAEVLAWAAAAFFLLGVATVFLCVAVVFSFPEGSRWLAAGLVCALFIALGGAAAWVARARMRERPRVLAATVAELERDRREIAGE